MGKGDKKTRRGKIYRSSYGNVRSHTSKSAAQGKAVSKKGTPARKTATRKASA